MTWRDVLFLHWIVDPAEIASRIPRRLSLDVYQGRCFVGVTAFTSFTSPSYPAFGAGGDQPQSAATPLFANIQVRTYVRYRDTRAVWVLSRSLGRIHTAARTDEFTVFPVAAGVGAGDSKELFVGVGHRGAPPHVLDVLCEPSGRLASTAPGSLEGFFADRSAYYHGDEDAVFRATLRHPAWRLESAAVDLRRIDIGIELPDVEPIAHCGRSVAVEYVGDEVAWYRHTVWPEAPAAQAPAKPAPALRADLSESLPAAQELSFNDGEQALSVHFPLASGGFDIADYRPPPGDSIQFDIDPMLDDTTSNPWAASGEDEGASLVMAPGSAPVERRSCCARSENESIVFTPPTTKRGVQPPAFATGGRELPSDLSGRIIGGFRIGKLIGRGGMGAVYAAISPAGHEVALKILAERTTDAQAIARFQREARAGMVVDDVHVLKTIGTGYDRGHHFIATELARGGSVHDLLAIVGRMPVLLAVEIVGQMLEGLRAVHATGLIHRDIKPSNMLLTGDGLLKLADFGVVKAPDDQALTQAGTVYGTPRYMSPEQLLGLSLDPRSDLFAVGTVLFELLTGRSPFGAEGGLGAIAIRVTTACPPEIFLDLPTAPELLDIVLQRLFAQRLDDRYQSASEVLSALEPLRDVVRRCCPDVVARALGEPHRVCLALRESQAAAERAWARSVGAAEDSRGDGRQVSAYALWRAQQLAGADAYGDHMSEAAHSRLGETWSKEVNDHLADVEAQATGSDGVATAMLWRVGLLWFELRVPARAALFLRRYLRRVPSDARARALLQQVTGADPAMPFTHLEIAAHAG